MKTLKYMKRYIVAVLTQSTYGWSPTKTLDYQALFALAAIFLGISLKLSFPVALFMAVSSQLLAMMWSKDVELDEDEN